MKDDIRLFCDRVRLQMGLVEAVDLRVLEAKTAPYRCDQVFELGVDLSDTLASYEASRVNETAVREAAVAVAVEALKVWLATTRGAGDGR